MPDLVAALRLDSGPPGFYLLERPFAAGGDALLRAPSLLAAFLLFAAAATLPHGRARTIYVALASCAALPTLYAAEARPYALLALLGLALFLLAARGEESAGRLASAAALSAAALWTHYLAIFVVAALVLLAAGRRRFRSALALAAGAAAFLPWLPVLRGQPGEAVAWMQESALASLAGFLSALGGVGRIPPPLGGPAPRLLFLGGIAAGALLLAAVAARARRDRDVRAALVFVAVVLGAAMLAGAWRPVAFAGRTEMAVLPVWIWAIAKASGESRAARWGAAAAVLLGAAATAAVALGPSPSTEASDIAAAVSRTARPADAVAAAGGFYLPMRREAGRQPAAVTVHALPVELAAHPGWFVPGLPAEGERQALAVAAGGLAPGGRLYVVLPPAYATPELLSALPGGAVRELSRSPNALVLLWTRPGP